MMWHSVEDTERFKFVPKAKVAHIPLGKFSWSFNNTHIYKMTRSKNQDKPNLLSICLKTHKGFIR